MAWPWQLYLVIVSILRKRTGGDRAVGIIAWLIRTWAKARSPFTKEWARQAAGAWDSAVAGSSALREALLRSFADESVVLQGSTQWISASILWDIAGFYDALSVEAILSTALDLGFPPIVLALEILVSVSPRVIREDGA